MERIWNLSGIEYNLQNEKYSGDLLLQKYYTVDFLTKKVAKNTGQLPQYFVENNHPPIIPKEIFLEVQAEMARRKKNWGDFLYAHDNALSGRVYCGECGTQYTKRGNTWRCDTKLYKGKYPGIECGNGSIKDSELRDAVVAAMNGLPGKKEELVRLEERLKWGGLDRADEVLRQIEAEIDAAEAAGKSTDSLRQSWAEASEQRAVYADKMLHIRSLLDRIRVMEEGRDRDAYKASPHRKCEKVDTFFRITQPLSAEGRVTECSEDDVVRYMEKVLVRADKVTVIFKAGVSVDVERWK